MTSLDDRMERWQADVVETLAYMATLPTVSERDQLDGDCLDIDGLLNPIDDSEED